jgi:predicted ArsR family transcriptional regulator
MAAKRARARSPFVAAPARPATDRQSEFLAAVAALTLANGEPPSASAVAAWLGISRIGARQQLKALEAKGLLVDVPRVVSSGKWALAPGVKP